jgi:hypothetical protein
VSGNPELIEQYRLMHASGAYGTTSVKSLRFLRPEIMLLQPRSILDYGCGQSQLLEELNLSYPVQLLRYDPAIAKWAKKPQSPVDLVINVDVLEHIEEEDLDATIADIAALGRDAIIIVDTRLAATTLPDGRNAHVTVRPHEWWHDRLSRSFPTLLPLATARRSRAGFKTWSRRPPQTLKYVGLRTAESARYYAGRMFAKIERSLAG